MRKYDPMRTLEPIQPASKSRPHPLTPVMQRIVRMVKHGWRVCENVGDEHNFPFKAWMEKLGHRDMRVQRGTLEALERRGVLREVAKERDPFWLKVYELNPKGDK